MDMDNVYVFTIPLCVEEPTEEFKAFIKHLGEPQALVAMFDVNTSLLRFMNCNNELTEIMQIKVGSDDDVIRGRISKSVSKLNFALARNYNVSITLQNVENDIKTYIEITVIGIDENTENLFNLIDSSNWSKDL